MLPSDRSCTGITAVDTVLPVDSGMFLPCDDGDDGEADLAGARLGPYLLRRRIGRGGMGAVYEARDERIGKRVAIKLLHHRHTGDPLVARRLLDEARALSLIAHPGLVTLHGYEQRPGGGAYLVMEYLEGTSLRDRLRGLRAAGERLSPEAALRIARQVASALSAAHAAGVVHCDLKPDNVFLVPDGDVPGGERAKVLDFGIARFLEVADDTTASDLVLGTPRYMSPEQCAGLERVDGKADVYALGVICYELLAGRAPFLSRSPLMLMRQQLRSAPPPLRAPDGTSPALCELILDAMSKDPARRPTMQELVDRLDALADGPAPAPTLRARGRAPGLTAAAVVVLLAILGGVALRGPGAPVEALDAPAPRPAATALIVEPLAMPAPPASSRPQRARRAARRVVQAAVARAQVKRPAILKEIRF